MFYDLNTSRELMVWRSQEKDKNGLKVHGDEVPEDILPRQEDELNHLDYQQYDAAVAVHI